MSSVRKGTLAQFGPSLLPWTHWLYQKESAMATNNSLWTMEIMRKWRSTCRNVARAGKILIKYPTHNSVCSESFQSLSRRKRKQESLSLTMILKNIWHPVNGTVKSHCVIKNHWTHRSETQHRILLYRCTTIYQYLTSVLIGGLWGFSSLWPFQSFQ